MVCKPLDYNIYRGRSIAQLYDAGAPLFDVDMLETEFTLEEEDLFYTKRHKGFIDVEKIVEWNLLSIDYAHDEVEDLGLDNSLHTLLVKCMIQN